MKRNTRLNNKVIQGALIAVAFACAICLSGCGALSSVDKALRENKTKSDDKYWTERNVPPVELDFEISCPGKVENFNEDLRVSRCVYRYLEDGNREMLKKMFAQSVIDSRNDLEGELNELIDYYQSLDVNDCEVKSNSYYKVNRVEPSETIREFTYRTEFNYSGNRYELEIMFVKDSTRDKDLLGVHGIRLRNRDTNDSVTVNTINSDI